MAKDLKKKEQRNNFLKEVSSELKKVTWPTRKELINSTGTVLLITITIAIIVFVLDFAFEKANTYGVDKLKAMVSSSQEDTTNSNSVDADNTVEPAQDATTQEAESTETPVDENAQAAQNESTEDVAQ